MGSKLLPQDHLLVAYDTKITAKENSFAPTEATLAQTGLTRGTKILKHFAVTISRVQYRLFNIEALPLANQRLKLWCLLIHSKQPSSVHKEHLPAFPLRGIICHVLEHTI